MISGLGLRQRRAGGGPVLRAPPFPGARRVSLGRAAVNGAVRASQQDVQASLAALRDGRVGGTFWGAQPQLPRGRSLVLRPASAAEARAMIARAAASGVEDAAVLWPLAPAMARGLTPAIPVIAQICDPWALFDQAHDFWLNADDPLVLLARVAGKTVVCFGEGRFSALGGDVEPGALEASAKAHLVEALDYSDPYTGCRSDALRTIACLAEWRRLIDANRPINIAAGFAFWKRPTVAPLLWNGTDTTRFISTPSELPQEPAAIALWRSRVSPPLLEAVADAAFQPYEVEDGFIRSTGLGANCVPPLSIIVDACGPHFDPSEPSTLETIIKRGGFTPAVLKRADHLRTRIVELGISKYAAGTNVLPRPGGKRRHILVTGQVEDDRSVLCGGGDVAGNLDLLKRARVQEPDSYILYKPHPDVEAGHRKGRVAEAAILEHADEIVRDASISALLDMVDGIHVLTSLAGFEALMRDKHVTTHGVPFYAGWGLTTDLGPVPSRRHERRTIDELIAAAIILYPRYLDPVTRLPCQPELLLQRMADGVRRENRGIVAARRVQGLISRALSRSGGQQ